MDQQQEMTFDFDNKSDVLYVSFGDPREAISIEAEDGVVFRMDPETEQIVGFTVLDFSKRSQTTLSVSTAKMMTTGRAYPI